MSRITQSTRLLILWTAFLSLIAVAAYAGETTRVSVSSIGEQGNTWSSESSLSADGRFVAFESLASNLVPDDTNNTSDVFVRDRLLNTTKTADLQVAVISPPVVERLKMQKQGVI